MKRTKVFLVLFLLKFVYSIELEQPDVGIVEFEAEDVVEDVKTEEQMEESFEIHERGAVYDSVTGKRRYDNYQLIRVNPETDEHLDVLQFLEKGKY